MRFNKHKAVIYDIDGVLFNHGPFVSLDHFYKNIDIYRVSPSYITKVMWDYEKGYKILFVTARDEVCRTVTHKQLIQNLGFRDYELYMRKSTDKRDDWEVKQDYLYQLKIKYDIIRAYDDNYYNIQMYHRNNIPTEYVRNNN